ncbi:MAG: YitT family protein, partial [Sphaerochaetaceae bacterium]
MISKKSLTNYLLIVVGSIVTAFGVGGFITPAKLAGGGVSGLAVVLYHTVGLEVGTAIFVLSLPLFLIGIKIFGFKYGITSFIGTLLLSFFTFLVGKIFGFGGFLEYKESMDVLLSALFGGFLQGFGIGLVMKGGANTGGTDIAAQILSKYTPLSVGTSLFIVDGLVITVGGLAFGLLSALFATITLYV